MAEDKQSTAGPDFPAIETSDEARATAVSASMAPAVDTESSAPHDITDATPEEKEAMLRKLHELYQLNSDADSTVQTPDPLAAPEPTPQPIDSPSPEVEATTRLPFAVRVTVVNSLQRNKDAIPLVALSYLLLIEQRLGSLQGIEAGAAIAEVRLFEDLKERVENFLIALETEDNESLAVAATLSLAEDIRDWWTTRHVEICENISELTIFLSAMTVMHLTGADTTISAVVSGAKNVVDALKAARERYR